MNEVTEVQTEEKILDPSAIAVVNGIGLTKLPEDLYIPPHALEILLETFEGPLDLLLYLIRKENIDILNIPILKITQQYMDYIGAMEALQFTLAAEYLVMAATLAEIKSRMLLPRHEETLDEEGDPRADLIRRLQEYERFKSASEKLDDMPRVGRDLYLAYAQTIKLEEDRPLPQVQLEDLLKVLGEVLQRAKMFSKHEIAREPLSIRERMTTVLHNLQDKDTLEFSTLFTVKEGRMGVVVTFIAILELLKEHLVDIVQVNPFDPIYVKRLADEPTETAEA